MVHEYIKRNIKTALQEMTCHGVVDLVKELLDYVDDTKGLGLLLIAYKNNYENLDDLFEMMTMLLESGKVDVNEKIDHSLCLINSKLSMLSIILYNMIGMAGDLTRNDTMEDNKKILQLLMKYGADMNSTDDKCNTILHEICYHYKDSELINLMQWVLDNGADINAINNNGETALIVAYKIIRETHLSCGHKIALLYKNDADAAIKDKTGKTAIHYDPSIKLLIQSGNIQYNRPFNNQNLSPIKKYRPSE